MPPSLWMDEANCALAAGLVSPAYINQGSQALARRRKRIKSLLSQRRLPAEGWDDASIELLLQVRRQQPAPLLPPCLGRH